MRTLRSRLALVLLLCFVRVLLPDTWVLAMHAHTHTTDEPTEQVGWPKGKALLSSKHQHCDADNFYSVAFQTPAPLLLPAPVLAYAHPTATPRLAPVATAPAPTLALRGPPSQH
ncbi:hypothetical protein [Hymenobacter mucosus]|uniref:Uncharacterized protein n=1 Tax=Hymenobacter mucosus TaxID=1411120 RepID=A0A238YZ62_9BACT|nr:hypothetical protein [Hymenobacter mucosus]SNR76282.1 hypothetical protein SAMN06269173_106203 [Hymenobacter mucosus]